MFISMRIFIKATNRSLIEICPSAGALRRRIRKSCSALGIKVNELGLRRIGISQGKGVVVVPQGRYLDFVWGSTSLLNGFNCILLGIAEVRFLRPTTLIQLIQVWVCVCENHAL